MWSDAETFQLCWLDVSSTCGSIFEALQCDWVCWVWASGDFHRIMWPSWLHIYKFFKAVRISHWDDPDPDGWTDPVDHLVAGVLQPISSSVSCFVLHLHSYVTSVQKVHHLFGPPPTRLPPVWTFSLSSLTSVPKMTKKLNLTALKDIKQKLSWYHWAFGALFMHHLVRPGWSSQFHLYGTIHKLSQGSHNVSLDPKFQDGQMCSHKNLQVYMVLNQKSSYWTNFRLLNCNETYCTNISHLTDELQKLSSGMKTFRFISLQCLYEWTLCWTEWITPEIVSSMNGDAFNPQFMYRGAFKC